MVAVIALLLVIAQVGEQDELSHYGLKPNTTIVAMKGVATIDEDKVMELVGLVDLSAKDPQPWGADGKLLEQDRKKLFWEIVDFDEKQRKLWTSNEDRGTFVVAFWQPKQAFRGRVSRMFGEDATYDLRMSSGKLADEDEGRNYSCDFFLIAPKKNRELTFEFEVSAGQWIDLLQFEFADEVEVDDFSFAMSKYETEGFEATQEETVTFKYDVYRITATLPEVLRDLELQIATNDPEPEKDDDDFMLMVPRSMHFRGEDIEEEGLEGHDLFEVTVLQREGFKRKFTLQARPKLTLVFKDLPKRPESA